MKVLLAVTMTMLLTGSAFGACSKESSKECTTRAECEGIKYIWNEKADVKCISTDGAVATNCAEGNAGKRDAKDAGLAPSSSDVETGKGKSK